MTTWKIDVENKLGFDLGKDDIYGIEPSSWEVYYTNNDGSITAIDGLTEVIKPIESAATTTVSASEIGNKVIEVEDTTDFAVGMVINVQDTDMFFYIDEVTESSLVVRKPVTEDINDKELKQVGNTGFYSNIAVMSEVGQRFLVINNPSLGIMNRMTKIDVIDTDDNDVVNTIEEKYKLLKDKLDIIDADMLRKDDVDGEIIV